MNFDLFKEYEPLYIIGHKNPDVDSVVSTTILYNIFKSKGIECFPCFLESYEVDEYNLSMIGDCMTMNMKIINNDDNYHYVLVDHNDPTQSVGFGKKIVWGIDHHKSSNILSNVNNNQVGEYETTYSYENTESVKRKVSVINE